MASSELSNYPISDQGFSSYLPSPPRNPHKAENSHIDLLAFLAIAQTHVVDFLPITWQPALGSIGSGASGDVLQATVVKQLGLAFKQFSAVSGSGLTDLIREVRILQHPPIRSCVNIIPLEGVCWRFEGEEMKPVLVYRLGRSLVEFLRDGDVDFEVRLRCVRNIGNGLIVLHESGAVHGDLKPENIIMSMNYGATPPTEFPQIADFSNSQFSLGEQDKFHLPRSVPWCAPEWHARLHSIKQAQCMDVYSYGLLSYWILFGAHGSKAAVHADDVLRIKQLVVRGTLREEVSKRMPADHTESLVDILNVFFIGCLSNDPKKRHSRISHDISLLQDLDRSKMSTIAEVHEKHIIFEVPSNVDQLLQLDYKIRRKLFHVLEGSLASKCPLCVENGALQTALCHHLALGTTRDVRIAEVLLRQYDISSSNLQQQIDTIRDCHFPDRPGQAKWYIEADLALLYQERGDLDEAIKWHEEEALTLKECLGSGHRLVTMTMATLVHLLDATGQTLRALDICVEQLKEVKSSVDEGHHDAIAALSQVALYEWKAGHIQEAITAGEQLVNLIESSKSIQETDRLAMSSFANLAGVYADAVQHAQAIAILERLTQVHDEVLGPDHPESLASRQTLAACYVESVPPRFTEALKLQAEVLAGWRKNVGAEHRRTLGAATLYALTLAREGSNDRLALETLQWTMDTSHIHLGGNDPETWIATSNYAYRLVTSSRYGEAIPMLRQSLQNLERLLPEEHRSTVDVMLKLSTAYTQCDNAGYLAEAERLLLKALNSQACVEQKEPTIYLWVWSGLGNVYQKKGNRQQAKEAFEKALLQSAKHWGLHHPAARQAMKDLALLHIEERRHDEGIRMLEEVVTWYEKYPGRSAWEAIVTRSELGAQYNVLGKDTKAREILSDNYEYAKTNLGEMNLVTIDIQGNLAYALRRAGELLTAKSMTEDVLSKRRSVLGQLHEDTILTIRNLLRVYLAMDLVREIELLVPQIAVILDEVGDKFDDHTTVLQYMLAEFYSTSERVAQGETLFRSRLKTLEGKPANLKELSTVQYCLAYVLSGTDRLAEAEELLRRALSQRSQLYGEVSSPTLYVQSLLGVVLRDMGDLVGAEDMFQREFETAIALQDPSDFSDIVDARDHLITVYEIQGNADKIENISQKVERLRPR